LFTFDSLLPICHPVPYGDVLYIPKTWKYEKLVMTKPLLDQSVQRGREAGNGSFVAWN